MAPSEDITRGSLGFKYPKNRDILGKCGDAWLNDKRNDDGAEGLWRIHNDLYDLNDFMNKHPGGKMWLELTKGTDVTEAFEVHHLTSQPFQLLPTFHVRRCTTTRNSPFTFREDGFYQTLKKEILKELPTIPRDSIKISNALADGMLIATFILAILANYLWSYTLAMCAGVVLCWTTIIGHNYFHRKDNFRMYYFDLSLMASREWRISHSLSHHLLTNTIQDLEISMFEPILEFLPKRKTLTKKYVSCLLSPIVWLILFHISFIKRVLPLVLSMKFSSIKITNFIPFILTTFMYYFGQQSVIHTFWMWNVIIFVSSFVFGFIGLNAAHHHPDIFHDGDKPRKDKDWGLAQLDTIMDRKEVMGNYFLVMTNFGDHALHHMFPTLDHGLLQHLYPTFWKVCKDFNIELRITSQFDLIKGHFQQLKRTEPNPQETDLLKYSKI